MILGTVVQVSDVAHGPLLVYVLLNQYLDLNVNYCPGFGCAKFNYQLQWNEEAIAVPFC